MNEQPISIHLTKDLDPTGVDEVWSRIQAKRGRAKRPARALAFGLPMAVFAIVGFVTWNRGRSVDSPIALRLESGAPLPASLLGDVALDDGSRIIVEKGGSLGSGPNTGHAVTFT